MKTKKNAKPQVHASNIFYENQVTAYMDKVKFGLLCSLIFVFLTEVFMFLLIKYGDMSSATGVFFIHSRWIPDFAYIKRHVIIPNAINWSSFFIFLFVYNRASFLWKKISICTIYLICTSVYCFGHWGFIYLSIIYVIPVILTCPFGKRANTIMFAICAVLQVIYSFYHYYLVHSIYNLLVASMNIAALVAVYFICFCVFGSFMNLVKDVQKYATLTTELKVKVKHDALTGAFSKQALNELSSDIKIYNSIAFIDLDNFKEINDSLSHAVGDEILKTLVNSFKEKGQMLFRYGGDEFIAFSSSTLENMQKMISEVKDEFVATCKKNYNADATFSAGIAPILENSTMESILNDADKIMYSVKKNGKNGVEISRENKS